MERVNCCLHNNNMSKNTYLVNNDEQIYNTREDNRHTGFDKGDVMTHKVLGIHHITAISGAPHENYNFYVRTLGLKLVKKTVNYDDPGTYHLYYGDETGSPGSLLTFFPYEGKAGKPGPGQVTVTGYAVPKGQLSVWEERLASHGIVTERGTLFGEERLSFVDPHGMGVELTETESAKSEALGTFHKATITLVDLEPTRELLEFSATKWSPPKASGSEWLYQEGRISWTWSRLPRPLPLADLEPSITSPCDSSMTPVKRSGDRSWSTDATKSVLSLIGTTFTRSTSAVRKGCSTSLPPTRLGC